MAFIVEIDKKMFKRFQKDILCIEKNSFITPWKLPQFVDELNNPYSHMWGLIEGEELIGYICFWMVVDEVHIMNIAIRADMRRKGMAKLLLSELIRFAKSRNMSKIWLEVRPSNKAALSLYKKMGFKKVAIRKKYYSDTNEDAIVMALEIGQKA